MIAPKPILLLPPTHRFPIRLKERLRNAQEPAQQTLRLNSMQLAKRPAFTAVFKQLILPACVSVFGPAQTECRPSACKFSR